MYCKNCGNEILENGKFCGKCGAETSPQSGVRQSFQERIEKHSSLKTQTSMAGVADAVTQKKPSRTDEAVLLLGFLLSLGSSVNDNFGFVSLVDAESAGRNFMPFVSLLLFVVPAIRIIKKAKKNDAESSLENGKKRKYFRDAILKVGIMFAVLFSFGAYHYANQEDVGAIFNDALYGTNTSGGSEYAKALADIFAYYKEESAKKYSNTVALDTIGLLEFHTLETKQSLSSVIDTLKASIGELSRFEEIQTEIREGAREKIRNSNLSESEKIEVLKGFNSSANDVEQAQLSKRRNVTLKTTYEETLKLYEFLYQNFSGYEIETDSAGNQNIAFYTDKNIATYDKLLQAVQSASGAFEIADKQLSDYGNTKLKNVGAGVTVDEVANAIQ
jgi:hypothetical protein